MKLNTSDSNVNFFVFAYWGGLPIVHRTLIQESTAYQMGKLGLKYNTKFQIGLGDNFYCIKS